MYIETNPWAGGWDAECDKPELREPITLCVGLYDFIFPVSSTAQCSCTFLLQASHKSCLECLYYYNTRTGWRMRNDSRWQIDHSQLKTRDSLSAFQRGRTMFLLSHIIHSHTHTHTHTHRYISYITTLLLKYHTFLRKPGRFQWSTLAWNGLEPWYECVNFFPRVNSVSRWQAEFEWGSV